MNGYASTIMTLRGGCYSSVGDQEKKSPPEQASTKKYCHDITFSNPNTHHGLSAVDVTSGSATFRVWPIISFTVSPRFFPLVHAGKFGERELTSAAERPGSRF
eukprot:scpid102799/ scgid33573/ 